MDPATVLPRLKYLIEQEFFSSAKFLSGLLISSLEFGTLQDANVNANRILSQAYFYHAEGLVGLEQYKRAISYYSKSLSQYKILKINKIEIVGLISESYVKYRLGKMHYRFDDFVGARNILDSIPDKQRSSKVWMLLGMVFKGIVGENLRAINAFKQVLKENPDCIEAINALQDLSSSMDEIAYSLKTASNESWLFPFAQIQSLMVAFEYDKAITMLQELQLLYPSNIDVLLMLAECYLKCGRTNMAIETYSQIQRFDENVLEHMNRYTALLKHQGKENQVYQIASRLMQVDPRRPEPWLAMSRFLEMRNEKENALAFIEKALELAPNNRDAYLMKGGTLIGMERASDAIVAYRFAHKISRDLLSFQGLIESYIGMSRIKDALAIAKEAIQLMPKNPKMLTLVGVVLSHTPNGREKAKKAFENALALDPHCTEAVIAIVSTNLAKKEWQPSIELLQNQLKFEPSDFLHTRLADIYSLSNDFSNALIHYNAALSINNLNDRAIEGIMRVEKLLSQANDVDKQGTSGSLNIRMME